MRKRFWILAAVVASCAPELPSTAPLGRGPLAASTVETPQPPLPAASPTSTPDASVEANATDAGTSGADDGSPQAVEAGGDAEPEAGATDAAPEAAAGARTALFAGHYSGHDVTTLHMPGVPAVPQKDPNAKLDVADPGTGTLEFSLLDSRSGKLICKLEGTRSGNTAQLAYGQHCFDSESQGHMTATLDTGTATFNGSQLVFDLHLDMEINVAGHSASGSIDYHFEGTRK